MKSYVLYHGTTSLLTYGWSPNSGCPGANCGQSKYLYLTNNPENAKWFAEQHGDSVVLELIDIAEKWLLVDPEDGYKNSVSDELSGKMPGNVVLIRAIGSAHFRVF